MLLRNTLYQMGGQAITKLLAFLFYIFLARLLSVEVFGQFNFIFAYAAIFGILMDFGLDVVVAKRVASSPQRLGFLYPLFKFKLQWVGLVFVIFFLVTLFIKREGLLAASLFAGMGVGLYSLLVFTFGIYRGKEALQYEAFFAVLQKVLYIGLAMALVLYGFSLVGVFGALVFASLVALLSALYFTWKRYGTLMKVEGNPGLNVRSMLFREALPLLFVSFFTLIYFRVDTLMLAFLKGDYEVGIYNAAYRLMEGMILIPAAFMAAFFPRLVRAAGDGRRAFEAQFNKGLLVLTVLGLVTIGVAALASGVLIPFFWGSKYLNAVPLFQILLVALFIIYLNYLFTQAAIALNAERVYSVIVAGGALLNVVLNYLWIPVHGAKGAAAATVCTEMFLCVALVASLQKYMRNLQITQITAD